MKLGFERAYRNISSYVPPQARAVLENEVQAINKTIDEEVVKFGEELAVFIQGEVDAATASLNKELEDTRADFKDRLDKLISAQDTNIASLQAAAGELKAALDKEKEIATRLGETAQKAVVTGLKSAGLPIPA